MKSNKLLTHLTLMVLLFGCRTKIADEKPFMDTEIAELVSITEATFPNYNAYYQPPPELKRPFSLSQDYPEVFPDEDYTWEKIDFKKSPTAYMNAVLHYCLEGNAEIDFKGQENIIRKWYHAPWLHDDGRYAPSGEYIGNGREFIHGLTRELATPKFEIHNKQDIELENWAVGMYNAPGGYTIGKVWADPEKQPDPKKANFPNGTVSFKLLFTDGTIDKVPFLTGSLEWQANIYLCNPRLNECANKRRQTRAVRLLQIDFAVKDQRADKTGWVFGTFIYDGSSTGRTVWERMVPVGLSWGDDPTITKDLNRNGAFINDSLKESYINPALIVSSSNKHSNGAYVNYHGLGGRLNGPVDNLLSSCVSCHGQAGNTDKGTPLPLGDFEKSTTRANYSRASFNQYFLNISSGAFTRVFKGENYTTTDYSLQISAGIRNYHNNILLKNKIIEASQDSGKELKLFSKKDVETIARYLESLPEVTRGEN
jgi:hypothetical protein